MEVSVDLSALLLITLPVFLSQGLFLNLGLMFWLGWKPASSIGPLVSIFLGDPLEI